MMGSRFAGLGKFLLRSLASLPQSMVPKHLPGHASKGCAERSRSAVELLKDEGVVESEVAEGIVSPGWAAVAGRHDGLEQQGAAVRLERPQPRHVLGGLPVHHLAVV